MRGSLLVVLGLVLVMGAGCADEDPPEWLLPSTTTTAPTTTSTTTTSVPGATTTTRATPVTELVAGDCVVGDAFGGTQEQATEGEVVDCATQHDAEVVGLVTYEQPGGEPYPGQEQVAAFAEEQCATTFETYVGTPFGESEYQLLTLWPTESSWGSGDREAVCLAFSEAGPLTASVAAG